MIRALTAMMTRSSSLPRLRLRLRLNRPLSTSSTAETLASSSSSTTTAAASSSTALKPKRGFLGRGLMYGIFIPLSGALAATGFLTYAYTADEVDEKTKAFRSSIYNAHGEKGFPELYHTIMTVPAKVVDQYLTLRRTIAERVREIVEPSSDKLLPDMDPQFDEHRIMTLVLDLRETLIHSEWKREIGWSTFKRPGLDGFLEHMAQFYEIVIYTDELDMALYPIQEKLQQYVPYFLGRAATKYQDGKHYRDLSKLNRDPARVIYISGRALENCLQPENCISVNLWKNEVNDSELIDLIPFLEYVSVNKPNDIRTVLASYHGKDIPTEFITRSKQHLRRQQEKRQHSLWGRR